MIKLIQLLELEVNNPNLDWKYVWATYCFLRQDYEWDELYNKIQIFKDKYHQKDGMPKFMRTLSQPELNKLYRELKQLENGK